MRWYESLFLRRLKRVGCSPFPSERNIFDGAFVQRFYGFRFLWESHYVVRTFGYQAGCGWALVAVDYVEPSNICWRVRYIGGVFSQLGKNGVRLSVANKFGHHPILPYRSRIRSWK